MLNKKNISALELCMGCGLSLAQQHPSETHPHARLQFKSGDEVRCSQLHIGDPLFRCS